MSIDNALNSELKELEDNLAASAEEAADQLPLVEETLSDLLRRAGAGPSSFSAMSLSEMLSGLSQQSYHPSDMERDRQRIEPELDKISTAIENWKILRTLSKI